MLPRDNLGEHSDRAVLRAPNPKSGNRGGASVQHITVVGPRWVRMLVAAFGSLQDEDLLYPMSPATYRSRWDTLLRALHVPRSLALTPGGLRGGGAVDMYLADRPIADIMWRMRLRDQSSLAHYLQEVAAVSSLRALPQDARDAVASCNGLFLRLFG